MGNGIWRTLPMQHAKRDLSSLSLIGNTHNQWEEGGARFS
jgi:hypothetical protein